MTTDARLLELEHIDAFDTFKKMLEDIDTSVDSSASFRVD